MTDSAKPVVSWTTPQTPIIDKATGQISFTWLKWFQGIQQTINGAFDQQGNFDGNLGSDASITGRAATILVIIHNIDDTGVVTANGIDFSRAYLNKDTDHINDGSGSPLAGGEVAFAAMVASLPASGQILVFDGMHWLPAANASTIGKIAHEWLDSYNAATGEFTQSRPAFSDISGMATPAQLPPDIARIDVANTFTENQEIDGTSAFPVALSSADPGATAVRLLNASNSAGAWIGLVGSSGAGGAPSGSVAVNIDGTTDCPVYITPTALTVVGSINAKSVVLTSATTATSATTGAASALPADPAGYLEISINGTTYKLPYYNA